MKAQWCNTWICNTCRSVGCRLVALAAVQTLFGSSLVATLLSSKILRQLPGTQRLIEVIERDRTLSVQALCTMHSSLHYTLERNSAWAIIKDAVSTEASIYEGGRAAHLFSVEGSKSRVHSRYRQCYGTRIVTVHSGPFVLQGGHTDGSSRVFSWMQVTRRHAGVWLKGFSMRSCGGPFSKTASSSSSSMCSAFPNRYV